MTSCIRIYRDGTLNLGDDTSTPWFKTFSATVPGHEKRSFTAWTSCTPEQYVLNRAIPVWNNDITQRILSQLGNGLMEHWLFFGPLVKFTISPPLVHCSMDRVLEALNLADIYTSPATGAKSAGDDSDDADSDDDEPSKLDTTFTKNNVDHDADADPDFEVEVEIEEIDDDGSDHHNDNDADGDNDNDVDDDEIEPIGDDMEVESIGGDD